MTLTEKQISNPCGSRNIHAYLQGVRSVADELALVDNTIVDEDLVLYALAGLNTEFKAVPATIRVRHTSISFAELHDKLVDYVHQLKKSVIVPETIIPTANHVAHTPNRQSSRSFPSHSNKSNSSNPTLTYSRSSPNSTARSSWVSTNQPNSRNNRNSSYCNFRSRFGHSTKDCRKLAQFLRENDIQPTLNAITFNRPTPQQWLFDSGASHHVTSDPNHLITFADYGGPDEIRISDGKGLKITHNGNSELHSTTSIFLLKMFCVPSVDKNLISVAKFCRSKMSPLNFSVQLCGEGSMHGGETSARGESK